MKLAISSIARTLGVGLLVFLVAATGLTYVYNLGRAALSYFVPEMHAEAAAVSNFREIYPGALVSVTLTGSAGVYEGTAEISRGGTTRTVLFTMKASPAGGYDIQLL